ncbi:MAG TPA: ribosome-associated translation inhibitor RaiA [Porphyromonadaceae bacterium]|nr:ribosome-associated translation inhibitor RaiA [Porphyromonadaceae bacterium]
MDIKIKSIHFDAAEKLETFIEKKVSKLEQFYDGILMADIVLKVIKPETAKNKDVSIRLKIKSGDCYAEKVCDSFEEGIDMAVDALEKQLLKFKEKSREK